MLSVVGTDTTQHAKNTIPCNLRVALDEIWFRSGLANVNVAQVSMLLRIGERSGIQ